MLLLYGHNYWVTEDILHYDERDKTSSKIKEEKKSLKIRAWGLFTFQKSQVMVLWRQTVTWPFILRYKKSRRNTCLEKMTHMWKIHSGYIDEIYSRDIWQCSCLKKFRCLLIEVWGRWKWSLILKTTMSLSFSLVSHIIMMLVKLTHFFPPEVFFYSCHFILPFLNYTPILNPLLIQLL